MTAPVYHAGVEIVTPTEADQLFHDFAGSLIGAVQGAFIPWTAFSVNIDVEIIPPNAMDIATISVDIMKIDGNW